MVIHVLIQSVLLMSFGVGMNRNVSVAMKAVVHALEIRDSIVYLVLKGTTMNLVTILVVRVKSTQV